MSKGMSRRGRQTTYVGQVPKEHAHASACAISRGAEVGVVRSSRILHADSDAVVTLSTLALVVVLEVERRLGEAVEVRDVVNAVHHIEGIDDGSVHVCGDSRRLGGVCGVDERIRGGLLRNAARGGLVSDSVLSATIL